MTGATKRTGASLSEKLTRTINSLTRIYPSLTVKEIKVGKRKIRVYGSADSIWFKIIIDTRTHNIRVYSNSKTIENMAKKTWRVPSFEEKAL